MKSALTTRGSDLSLSAVTATTQQFVTMRLGPQLFGISVMAVRDVMRRQQIAAVPLAPAVIEGSLNLRGRIVTALNMRVRLGLPTYPLPEKVMKVVVEYQHELFALMVDAVGDVLALPMNRFEKVPANMDANWRAVAAGVFKLDNELLVILDVASVIDPLTREAA
jgi:purine-binding chemotaxis protein CheW